VRIGVTASTRNLAIGYSALFAAGASRPRMVRLSVAMAHFVSADDLGRPSMCAHDLVVDHDDVATPIFITMGADVACSRPLTR